MTEYIITNYKSLSNRAKRALHSVASKYLRNEDYAYFLNCVACNNDNKIKKLILNFKESDFLKEPDVGRNTVYEINNFTGGIWIKNYYIDILRSTWDVEKLLKLIEMRYVDNASLKDIGEYFDVGVERVRILLKQAPNRIHATIKYEKNKRWIKHVGFNI